MAAHFTSSTAHLPDGNHFAFTDSGAPASTDYTTLVFFHGSSFHAKTYDFIHEHAAANNTRVIAVQRRDYPGSSAYTDAELEDLRNGSKATIDGWAISVAHLVNYFANNLSIPKVSEDRKSGGIALVGWSMASVTVMALLSDMEVIPKELHPVLETYVKVVVLQDPGNFAFGIETPENKLFAPFDENEDETLEQKFLSWTFWVSGYFNAVENYNGDINGLDGRKRPERGSFDKWKFEDVMTLIEPSVGARSEGPTFVGPMQITVKEITRRVFFDKTLVGSNLPNVPVLYISCRRSIWYCAWAAYKFRELYEQHVSKGDTVRPVHFTYLDDGNHFAHIDIPDQLLKAILKEVN